MDINLMMIIVFKSDLCCAKKKIIKKRVSSPATKRTWVWNELCKFSNASTFRCIDSIMHPSKAACQQFLFFVQTFASIILMLYFISHPSHDIVACFVRYFLLDPSLTCTNYILWLNLSNDFICLFFNKLNYSYYKIAFAR